MGKKSDNNIPVNLGDDDDGGDGLLILGGGDKRSLMEPMLTAPTRYVHKSE